MRDKLKRYGAYFVISALTVFSTVMLTQKIEHGRQAEQRVQVAEEALLDAPTPKAMGWTNDPEAVAAVVAGLPFKSFRDTPAYQSAAPDHVYMWEAALKVLGGHLPCRDQKSVGSCVSFGSVCAVEYLQLLRIAGGRPEEFKELAQEIVYGGSRVEIGGGRIRGDGSTGAWGAQFCQRYGVLPRGIYTVGGQTYDLKQYSETTCRRLGQTGVPDVLEPQVKEHPVKTITPVRTAEECRKALANLYPVTVASDRGFTQTRDKDGFCRASGVWQHQMCVIGYKMGQRPGFYIMNSWSEAAFKGPMGEGNPPPGGFWADAAVVDGMLKQNDSWAYGDIDGFPAKNVNWDFLFSSVRPVVQPLQRMWVNVDEFLVANNPARLELKP